MTRTRQLEFYKWVASSALGLCTMIVTGALLRSEAKHRKSGSAQFTTPYLKWWAHLCILCSFVYGLSVSLKFFDAFCFVMPFVEILSAFGFLTCMGFYQLSRIYYCFSQSKVYSNKGYPDWLFVLMHAVGVVVLANVLIAMSLEYIPSSCGIDDEYVFQVQYIDYATHSDSERFWALYFGGIMLCYLCWDIATFLMYLLKLWSFRRYKTQNAAIYQRIVSILHRVVVTTILYEVTVAAVTVVAVSIFANRCRFCRGHSRALVLDLLGALSSMIYAYAMFLTLSHNTPHYVRFLRLVRRLRLSYICCGGRHMVVEQLKELDVNDSEQVQDREISADVSTYETADITLDARRKPGLGCTTSTETVTKH